jgi:hypothetical protein
VSQVLAEFCRYEFGLDAVLANALARAIYDAVEAASVVMTTETKKGYHWRALELRGRMGHLVCEMGTPEELAAAARAGREAAAARLNRAVGGQQALANLTDVFNKDYGYFITAPMSAERRYQEVLGVPYSRWLAGKDALSAAAK